MNLFSLGFVPLMPISYGVNYNSSGRCLYSQPVHLRDPDASVLSFSTTFTFSYDGQKQGSTQLSTNIPVQAAGFAFIIVADPDPRSNQATNGNASSLQYLGVLNATTNNRNSSHTFAVEFDIYTPGENPAFNDPPYDHVGIDLNSMNSSVLHQAGYNRQTCDTREFVPLSFTSGSIIQCWIDYEATEKRLTVSLGTELGSKPPIPLINQSGIDLSYIIQDTMWIGFSCAGVGSEDYVPSFVYAWSFNTSGPAMLTYSVNSSAGSAPYVSLCLSSPRRSVQKLAIIIPVCVFCLLSVAGFIFWRHGREKKFLEKEYQMIREEELEYGPIKFSYKTLRTATKNFSEKLAVGGFGSVYKGHVFGRYAVAVKRLSPNSLQGKREFFSEIRIIGQLRHGNLVQLQGFCNEKDELLLVYEFMPKGSLDHYLYNGALPWEKRFAILKGLGKALLYLHEEWDPEQCVVHRDVKPSNVMLDKDFNARLGDFGLATSYRPEEAATAAVTGTIAKGTEGYVAPEAMTQGDVVTSTIANGTAGYMAPEAVTQGEVSQKMDVYSFGVVALEVASGRVTRDPRLPGEQRNLLRWVLKLQRESRMEDAIDERLRGRCNEEEVLRVLEVGIWCCCYSPEDRPSMSQALAALDRSQQLATPERGL
ncbi:hypothetical protein O6H91_Y275000 [Diphasiastrum complanatum]|nr:hypothetical protein O6H91_Y275000 [Diphasiastrum complanatum]